MQIDRSALVERLRAFALEDHGLVTGAPGVGKTVVASQLASRLLDEGRGAVFVGTTDLADATAESIQAVLPHAGNLMDTLGAYFAQHRMPGVMIIDGFDAARDPVVRLRVLGLIRDLIFGALGRWHVIVTVRVYDAQKSPDLLGLFPPKAGRGPVARHIEVPRLEPQELEAVLDQVPGLSDLYRRGTRGLRSLAPAIPSLADRTGSERTGVTCAHRGCRVVFAG